MANSLADQLLKAGLVDAKKAKQVEKAKKIQRKQKVKNKALPPDESKLAAKKALAAKQLKSRELNQQKESASRTRAINAQIKQLILTNAIVAEGDLTFNFVDSGKIKKIYINDKTRVSLVNGTLSVVKLDDSYRLVPSVVADKIAQRDASPVLLQNRKSIEADEDAYADFKIPDDLMW